MREIETIGDRQTGMIVGSRQSHSDLAVILLSKLSAVLPCHTDRMLAFLGYAGVVDDQCPDWAALLNARQDTGPHRRQHRLVRPLCVRYEMMQ